MKFHLGFNPPKSEFKISHKDKILMMGSCFAENIGAILTEHRFNVSVNPGGIIFNPESLRLQLSDFISGKSTGEKYFLQRGEECFSFLHHSSIKGNSTESLKAKLDKLKIENGNYLREIDYLILTFGSAHYYFHKELGTCVANCHKQAGNIFEKILLSFEEIVNDYSALIAQLGKNNPKLKIIFTVSPVKYLRDGVIENNISKSTLILAVHALCKKFSDCCFYFPAYELVNDDLRDYRFYKEDLAHPNEQAIEYIWEKFSETYFDKDTQLLNSLVAKLNAAKAHRPLHSDKTEQDRHEKFIFGLEEEIKKFTK